MEKDSKIYVTGHMGLVGSAIVRVLSALGYNNILTCTHKELDLEEHDRVFDFFEKQRPDYVFLAAAKVGGILANNTYPVDFLLNNLKIQNNIIEASLKYSVNGLLFLGSSCIYPKMAPQPLKEEYLLTGRLEPTNEPYAIAKIAGIKLCEACNRQYKTHFLSVMPTNLYGPGDNYDLQTSHVLPALIRKFHLAKLASAMDAAGIKRDEETYGNIPDDIKKSLGNYLNKDADNKSCSDIILWGTGTPRREFLYVDDMAEACVFLMQNMDSIFPLDDNSLNSPVLFNIGWGRDISIKELADIVAEIVGYKGSVIWDSKKPDGTPQKMLDISRLTGFGFRPKINLKEGIRLAYKDYLE